MPTAPRPQTTPEEYLASERRAETKSEFFRNEVFAMAGASPRNVQMSGNIARAIGNQLVGRDCIVYVADLRVEVTATDSYAYPDVVVVCGGAMLSARDEHTITNPQLIVEVLSPATADYDRSGKFEHYRAIESASIYAWIRTAYTSSIGFDRVMGAGICRSRTISTIRSPSIRLGSTCRWPPSTRTFISAALVSPKPKIVLAPSLS